MAKDFCIQCFGNVRSASFAFSAVDGKDNAAILARAWAAKMQFCLNLSLEKKGKEKLSREEVQSWPEPSEFDLLASRMSGHAQCSKRVREIRELLVH